MPDLFDLRFITVVGKGGVGKTTVSAALALSAARRGKRVLVAMCNTKERLSQMLEVAPIGPRNQSVLPNVDAVNMNPQVNLEEYGMMVLKVRALYRAIFENKLVASFLRGTPGLEAWSMLGKAQFHAHEKDRQGRPRYDLVILDAPATGHGLDMLRVPRVLMDIAPPGLLRREAERAWELFSNPEKGGTLMVTLPEDMPANETLELHQALTQELHLPVCGLAINGLLPSLFSAPERDFLTETELDEDSPIASLIEAGRRHTRRERVQEDAVKLLAERLSMPRYELPQLFVPDFGRSAIEELSRSFD